MKYIKDQRVHSDSQVSALMDCFVPFNKERGPGGDRNIDSVWGMLSFMYLWDNENAV